MGQPNNQHLINGIFSVALSISLLVMAGRTRPIEKFASAVGKCSKESAEYGKCIVADYNNVRKDKCVNEFMKLQKCYTAAYRKG